MCDSDFFKHKDFNFVKQWDKARSHLKIDFVCGKIVLKLSAMCNFDAYKLFYIRKRLYQEKLPNP